MKKEELKELEKLKDFKLYVLEWDVYVKAEDFRKKAIECIELREENKKLREDNRFLTRISKEYMEKENIVQVTEFTELYKNDLEEENKKLNEKYNWLWDIYTRDVNERIEENKKLKETIKDHQLYEEKLEHRIIEFEELLHWE